MEEAIKFEVEDKDGNAVMAELVLLGNMKDMVELQMKSGKKVFSVDWEELRDVFTRALDIWDTDIKTE